MLKTIRGLPGTVWLIGLISLVNDSSSEMLYPLSPLYSCCLLRSPSAGSIKHFLRWSRSGSQLSVP